MNEKTDKHMPSQKYQLEFLKILTDSCIEMLEFRRRERRARTESGGDIQTYLKILEEGVHVK